MIQKTLPPRPRSSPIYLPRGWRKSSWQDRSQRGESERRRRQIEEGRLTEANGLERE